MIILDFNQDWKEYLVKKMSILRFEYNYSESLEENTIIYFNIKRKILSDKSRIVYESKQLSIPIENANDYIKIKNLINTGGDLKPYLSTRIWNDNNDSLFDNWRITHLHFKVTRTKYVLFVLFTDTEAYILQALPHGRDVWVDTQFIEILHNNWPKSIERYKTCIIGEHLTSQQIKNLREQGGNVVLTVSDGTNYIPIGGGILSSKRCFCDLRDTDKLIDKLKAHEEHIRINENKIREAIHISMSEKLSIKLVIDDIDDIDDMKYHLYEPDKKIRFNLNQVAK